MNWLLAEEKEEEKKGGEGEGEEEEEEEEAASEVKLGTSGKIDSLRSRDTQTGICEQSEQESTTVGLWRMRR